MNGKQVLVHGMLELGSVDGKQVLVDGKQVLVHDMPEQA